MTRILGLAFSSGNVSVKFGFAELVDHGHDEVRCVGAKQFLQPSDAVRNLHGEADGLAGLRELFFQLGAVCDEDHLPLGEDRVAIHLSDHEHHRE